MGSWERQKESEPCYPSQTFISWAISAVRFTCWFIPDRAASMVETVKSLTASLTSFSVATWDLLSWFMKGRYVKCRVTKRKTEHTHSVCVCVCSSYRFSLFLNVVWTIYYQLKIMQIKQPVQILYKTQHIKIHSQQWHRSFHNLRPKNSTYSFIFASASLNLTMASSCLTVMGIGAASPVSFACRLMSYKSTWR